MRFTKASTSAHATSEVELWPLAAPCALHRAMLRRAHASASMLGLRPPVLTMRRRLGSASISSAGKRVRSRMATMTSYG
jgi:hypothetical protein